VKSDLLRVIQKNPRLKELTDLLNVELPVSHQQELLSRKKHTASPKRHEEPTTDQFKVRRHLWTGAKIA
jgi:hypothetical protein